jgi:transposase
MEETIQPVEASPVKRRYRTTEEKRLIVEETLADGASVAVVARQHGVNANQVFHWRRLYQAGLLSSSVDQAKTDAARLLPVAVVEDTEIEDVPGPST